MAKDLPRSTRAVVLAVPDEAALLDLERRILNVGMIHSAVREPWEPYNGALMAIGVCPQPKTDLIKRLFSQLKKLE